MAEQKVTFEDGGSTTLESWGTSGPAVICVHGITSSRKSWERTALALQKSFTVFAYARAWRLCKFSWSDDAPTFAR
jgi:pimeloyl-ACP methyl ester carboxylesterase